MIQTARRNLSAYSAIFSMIPKVFMAYQLWFWIGLVLNIISMAILVFFWQAIYADTNTISGLELDQTLQYILLAFIFSPLASNDLVWEFGSNLREGMMIHHLLRPINFQGMNYAQTLGTLATQLILQIPMAIVAVVLFGLRFPTDLATWLAFIVSAMLGFTVIFFFYWFLACLTFYTTEIWGLGVFIQGMSFFFSGALVPLVMMPVWLQDIVLSVPFVQALGVPVSLLTGITPLSEAPQVWMSQILWIIAMWLISSLFFRVAVRKITVQGG
ncbi:MAG TPA: ABC-2 family transporter protein [Anaerolineales bacterium]|nr:ABC-2 family transporter protein [Anaerolineales bacterium]